MTIQIGIQVFSHLLNLSPQFKTGLVCMSMTNENSLYLQHSELIVFYMQGFPFSSIPQSDFSCLARFILRHI